MLSLADAQTNFIETINQGPDRLAAGLFTGPIDRVMLGLKAHANTISHARLVALEETFPLVRHEIGETAFNALSRKYAETAVARAADSNKIGLHFPDFILKQTIATHVVELAQIEWHWLESYHAAEANALTLADLAALDEESLLKLPVIAHPSLRLTPITAPLAAVLEGLAGQQPATIATLRPDAEVRLLPLNAIQSELAVRAQEKNCTLGNLIAQALEQAGDRAPLEPILHLISAGALVKAG